MLPFRTYLFAFLSILTAIACHRRNASGLIQNADEGDTLRLKISFHPAFDECCETDLVRYDTTKTIQILLRDFFGADQKQDTFYFKKIGLNNDQYLLLDSTLIRLCRRKLGVKTWTGCCDGMSVNSLFVFKNDTNSLRYRSSNRKTDSIGYDFVESVFTSLKYTFRDSIVTRYFQFIGCYIDDSKICPADSAWEFDRMRMKKYHWGIRKPNEMF